jgi:hypothetical protein
MSGIRIVPVNFFDEVEDLAVTSEASASLSKENLQSPVSGDVWRSTGLGTQVITGTFGGNARQISHLSIWPAREISCLIGAQVAVRMWSDVAQTTLTRDAAASDVFPATGGNWNEFLYGIQSWGADNADRTARLQPFLSWFSPVPVSAFEITITNAGNVDTPYFEASRIVLGDYVEAPFNAKPGAAPKWGSASEQHRSVGASLRRVSRARWRELRFETQFLTESDRSAWADLMHVCDPAQEIVCSLFPGLGNKLERDFTLLGSLEVVNPLVFEAHGLHTLQLALVES